MIGEMQFKTHLSEPLSGVWIYDNGKSLEAGIARSSYLPVTSFKVLNNFLNVEDAHPFETGEYFESTRFYRERYGYEIDLWSGISYHLKNEGTKYDLVEYLNQSSISQGTPEIWLSPTIDLNDVFNEIKFYDTLKKILTSIYNGHEIQIPDLSKIQQYYLN
jgi:hypothetical protein